MVKVILETGLVVNIPPKLYHTILILCKDLAEQEMDIVFVMDGHEGVGKSFGARTLGRVIESIFRQKYLEYMYTTFGPEDIYFSTDDYVRGSIEHGNSRAKKAVKINILDEGRNALNKMRRNSKSNVKFTNYLSECRAMQQVHIILAPAYHDLDKYLVYWRTSFVVHFKKRYVPDPNSKSGVSMVRGEYKLFTNKRQLRYYYMHPYKYPTYGEEWARFPKFEVFRPQELTIYNEKKNKATMDKYLDSITDEVAAK